MDLQKLKKINFKQPKYVFPIVILLPLLGLIYYVAETFSGSNDTAQNGLVKDSINMSLPEAQNREMDSKIIAMGKHFSEADAFTAIDAIGDEIEEKDTTGSGYNEGEMSDIDKVKAERLSQLKAEQELRRSHAENMWNLNSNASGYRGGYGSSYGSGSRSQQDDLNDYARELENIQNRSMERQRKYYEDQEKKEKEAEAEERRQRQELTEQREPTSLLDWPSRDGSG